MVRQNSFTAKPAIFNCISLVWWACHSHRPRLLVSLAASGNHTYSDPGTERQSRITIIFIITIIISTDARRQHCRAVSHLSTRSWTMVYPSISDGDHQCISPWVKHVVVAAISSAAPAAVLLPGTAGCSQDSERTLQQPSGQTAAWTVHHCFHVPR